MGNEKLICTGSLMDGVHINVLTWCGLPHLSDEQHDILGNAMTELDLFECCSSCEVIQTGEIDEIPGQSDAYFKIVSSDISKCKGEVRSEIERIIGRQNEWNRRSKNFQTNWMI